jgi:hypothetical protein
MLGLQLRDEFKGKRLKGTAIELSNEANTGATQVSAAEFLGITYPTRDLLKAIEAAGPEQGRPIVVIGERGLGKSHLLAALFHAVSDSAATSAWLKTWADILHEPGIGALQLRRNMLVIGESLHRQRYKHLWDILFDRHPHGSYIRGKWEGMGSAKTDIPSDELVLELLRDKPVVLLLDEFQTWYDGLTNTKQYPWKNWAFNFIQILSEIAKEHPDLLVLVVSVRNGASDAYQQIHRVNPVAIDFKAGGSPERMQQDRRRMLLHRLFQNRLQIAEEAVEELTTRHTAEYLRLLEVPPSDYDRKRRDFVDCWPFSPNLLQLLEDQVLIATDAQETRDLIRILANLFKARGESAQVLTPADFRLDDDAPEIGALLDSVAKAHYRNLREKAIRNVGAVREAVPDYERTLPHLQEIVGALWLRSIAVGNLAGAEPAMLQADITRDRRVDDNAFQAELATIVTNSFNIHNDGPRLVFREEENPQAKLMACARNDRLFADGSDLTQLAKEVRYVIGASDGAASRFHFIALPSSWMTDPWSGVNEEDHPDRWTDRLPLLILPEEPDRLHERLGRWLKDHLQKRRNTVRFVIPRTGSQNIFSDRDLLILARAEMKAQEWSAQSPEYGKLQRKYQSELRDLLKQRFDRFAILQTWNYGDPALCRFRVERISAQGAQIPERIEQVIAEDLFVPEDFDDLVVEASDNSAALGKVLRELQEPRPGGKDCIPWLGETLMKERVLRLCARGVIAINVRNFEYLQAGASEDETSAWKRLRSKLAYTGRHLDEIYLHRPGAVPATGSSPPAPTPTPLTEGTFAPLSPATPGSPGPGGTSPTSSTQPPSPSTPGGIFGVSPSSAPKLRLANPATSPLNLIGKLESWGVGPATQTSDVTIKVSAASGAQLKELLKKLPDGMTFELSLEKEGQ